MKTLLALDQASLTSGWSVWENNKLTKWGKFTAPIDGEQIGNRLKWIQDKVRELIKEYHIEAVAIEDIQLQQNRGNNVHTFKVLAEVMGVLESLFAELKLPYTIIPSSCWKSTLGIKGANRPAQKKNAQLYVTNTFGIKATQDECDAICIGAHLIKEMSLSWE